MIWQSSCSVFTNRFTRGCRKSCELRFFRTISKVSSAHNTFLRILPFLKVISEKLKFLFGLWSCVEFQDYFGLFLRYFAMFYKNFKKIKLSISNQKISKHYSLLFDNLDKVYWGGYQKSSENKFGMKSYSGIQI